MRVATTLSFLALLLGLTAAPARSQFRFVDDLPGTFVDISATGTPLNLANNAEANFATTIGNALFAAGTVRVAANGGVRFAGATTVAGDLASANEALPSAAAFARRKALLPFWDGLDIQGGNVYAQELGGVLIVQWQDVAILLGDSSDRITFQLQVHGTGNIPAQFLYRDTVASGLGGGSSATIGYQGGPGAPSIQYTFNAPDAVRNGLVLSLLPQQVSIVTDRPGAFVDIAATGTDLGLGNEQTVIVQTALRSALLPSGTLRINSNGAIGLGVGSTFLGAINQALPTIQCFASTQALVPFWDDLFLGVGNAGKVVVQEFQDRVIVQWNDVTFVGVSADQVTFQVQLFAEGPIAAQYLYSDVEGAHANFGSVATIGYQAGGVGNDVQFSFNTPSVSNGTVLSLLFSDEVGATYCAANANSTGAFASIRAFGTRSLAANDLRLAVSDLPQHSAAFFLVGTASFFLPHPGGSQGNLCVGGQIGRVVGGAIVNSGSSGRVSTNVDLLALPSPTAPFSAQVGQTLSFQCWFRDSFGGVPLSNFSNGVQVQIAP